MRVAIALLCAAVLFVGTGAAWLAIDVVDWLGHPLAIDSFAGLPVFRDASGQLGSYRPFIAEPAVTLVGVGIALVPVALVVGAALRRRGVY